MCAIDISLLADFPHADFHTVFGDDDVLALHLLGRVAGDVVRDRVGYVADRGDEDEEEKEEEEWEERVHLFWVLGEDVGLVVEGLT